MKIGILTYHKSHNYGALLQAIALRKVIERMGHEVYYVDYWPEYHKKTYAFYNPEYILHSNPLKTFKSLMRFILYSPYSLGRIRKFRKFIRNRIENHCENSANHFDLIVCGSDQIWRKQPGLNGKFNPTYFAAGGTNADNYISYAASMGIITTDNKDKELLKEWLQKFNAVSVREESLKLLLDELKINSPKVVADPTLLLPKEIWQSMLTGKEKRIRKKYLVYYTLQNDAFDIGTIQKYAEDNNLEIIWMMGGAGRKSFEKNTITCADPYDMMNLIANAEMVFTSSYHGLVFSIIFERQFVTSFTSNSGRAQTLLAQLGLQDRLIEPVSKQIPADKIDYVKVESKLREFREDSILWLSNSINRITTNKDE